MQKIDLDPAINNTIINMRLKKYKEIISNAWMTADVQEFSATLELGMEFIETEITDEILKDTGVTLEEAEQAKRVVKCYVKFREILEGFFRQSQIPDVPVLASFWKKMADTDTETRYSFLSSLYKKGKLRDDWMNLWDTFQKEHPAKKPQTPTDLLAIPNDESSGDIVSLIAGDGDVCEGEAALKSIDEDGCTVLTSESPPEMIDGFLVDFHHTTHELIIDTGHGRYTYETYKRFKAIRDDFVKGMSHEDVAKKYSVESATLYSYVRRIRKIVWNDGVNVPSPHELRSRTSRGLHVKASGSLYAQFLSITDERQAVDFIKSSWRRCCLEEMDTLYNESIHDELSALRALTISNRMTISQYVRFISKGDKTLLDCSHLNPFMRVLIDRCPSYSRTSSIRSSEQLVKSIVQCCVLDGSPYERREEDLLTYAEMKFQELRVSKRFGPTSGKAMITVGTTYMYEDTFEKLVKVRLMCIRGLDGIEISNALGVSHNQFKWIMKQMCKINWPDGLKL